MDLSAPGEQSLYELHVDVEIQSTDNYTSHYSQCLPSSGSSGSNPGPASSGQPASSGTASVPATSGSSGGNGGAGGASGGGAAREGNIEPVQEGEDETCELKARDCEEDESWDEEYDVKEDESENDRFGL